LAGQIDKSDIVTYPSKVIIETDRVSSQPIIGFGTGIASCSTLFHTALSALFHSIFQLICGKALSPCLARCLQESRLALLSKMAATG